MKICVLGLWHLGSVTAACVAAAGHAVIGLDFDEGVIAGLADGRPPIMEPGLAELTARGLEAGRLHFTTDVASAVGAADVVWVAYDTPVDDEDVADVGYVRERILRVFPHLRDGASVVVSSQMPVGSVRDLESAWYSQAAGRHCHFAYSPENLRLGKALAVFQQPDRIVVGVRDAAARAALEPLFDSLSPRIEWMGIEAAEMTKHAINAFLATSIVFANELAAVCERVGADARDVARGLMSEARIGPGAYLAPGGPFAGGTLARDINFLVSMVADGGPALPLIAAVKPSNDRHRGWAERAVADAVGELSGATVAILGLTYKSGTDTLRRSAAIELARRLVAAGAKVRGFDPDLAVMPAEEAGLLDLCGSAEQAVAGADATVLSTVKPELVALDWDALISAARRPVVVDAAGVLRGWAQRRGGLSYSAVGLRLKAGGEA